MAGPIPDPVIDEGKVYVVKGKLLKRLLAGVKIKGNAPLTVNQLADGTFSVGLLDAEGTNLSCWIIENGEKARYTFLINPNA